MPDQQKTNGRSGEQTHVTEAVWSNRPIVVDGGDRLDLEVSA